MEQLQIKSDQFRKQGRLQDKNLEDIINKVKAEEQFKESKENSRTASLKDKHRRVPEAVEEGLLQVHGVSILVTPVFVCKKEFLFLSSPKGFWRSLSKISLYLLCPQL
jgi:hypothetical protein